MIKTENYEIAAGPVEANRAFLLNMYRLMVLIRTTEETVADMLEKGEIRCPTHLYTGQEAIAVGVCAALSKNDLIFGGHRSHGHYLAKGGDLKGLVAELFGKAAGCAKGRGGSMHLVAPEIGLLGTVPLVAATIPIAVGAALASKLRGDQQVSVAFFGDGATEEGHFHESVNLAAANKLPVLFVCENNLYSSHMHILQRRAADNIFKTGEAHGIPGIPLDGNDVLGVFQIATAAVGRAKKGDGPTLMECRTYRWRGHVGPSFDMDVGVKRKDELKDWIPRDPILRARKHLHEFGVLEDDLSKIQSEVRHEVDEAIEFGRRSPYPDTGELLDHIFVSPERE
jgi:pyruvate dehydrogenase E1 component alpha subunit